MLPPRLRDLSLALLASLALAGCGAKDDKTPAAPPAGDDHHKAPHGGEVLELGNEEGHLEMLHDPDGGKVTVYVFGSGFDKPVSVAKPTISIQTKDGPADVPLTALDAKADGTAHGWKGEHAGLKTDPWDGRIRVKIDGKDYQSPLEGEGHAHK